MNKKILKLGFLAVMLLGLSTILYFSNFVEDEEYNEEIVDKEIIEISEEDMNKYIKEENSKVESTDSESEIKIQEKIYDMSPGEYISYSKEAYDEAIKDRKVVLFFHATWCPTCKVANANFEQNIDQIPDGVTVFKVDYDAETDLKKEYAITYQHVFIQVDEEGAILSRWAGGDIQELVDNLK